MSTKTNFKRIALVAVAALGMGVLSSVPSQAVISTGTFTLVADTVGTSAFGGGFGAASTGVPGAISDTTTGAKFTVSFIGSVVGTAAGDSISISVTPKSKPSGSTQPVGLLTLADTTTSANAPNIWYDTNVASATGYQDRFLINNPSLAGVNHITDSANAFAIAPATANKYTTVSFWLQLDSGTARATGTYVYTILATPFSAGVLGAAGQKSVDVSITVGAAGSVTASSAYSSAVLTTGATFTGVAGTGLSDSSVSVAATASTTPKAVIRVTLKDSTGVGTITEESVTVVSSVGSTSIVSGTVAGKNVTYKYTAGTYLDVFVYGDGTAGTSTITISTPSVTFATKTVTFYTTTATKLTVVSGTTNLGVGSNTMTALGVGVVWVKATDALGNTVVANATGGSGVYAYSSDKGVVSDSGTACAYSSTTGYHHCALTGVVAGSATITIKNLGTNINAATVSGDKTVVVNVTNSAPAKLKLAFNKSSYAPGEKGYILISVVDSADKVLPGAARTEMVTSSGISTTAGFSGALPTLNATGYTTYAMVASVDSIDSTDPIAKLTFYAPFTGTSMTISATGGTLFPAAGQVKVSATASITDSGAAALAAVTALATTVASLKTLITTLTNLVLKIQKKVKA